MGKIKVTHYRLVDTGRTNDLATYWQEKGVRVVPVIALEVQKSKDKWEPVRDGSSPAYGYGWGQAIGNLRFHIHHRRRPVHAYQIDGINETPLIAVPLGYDIEWLSLKGKKSWENASYYIPMCEEGNCREFKDERDGSMKVFKTYREALDFLRNYAGAQEYPYDEYRLTF
jgi:hypothetical protein